MTAPNFFLVGAPKCGTTALATYLREHPRVFMCMPKEPHYFALDLPAYRHVSTWDEYAALFAGAGQAHLAIGEASVFYMYSDPAIVEIRKSLPSARLLVMLRNPLDLAVSLHAQMLWSCDESVAEFDRAWALCADRRVGKNVPRGCRDNKTLCYDRVPLLGSQLRRLLEVFPRAQVGWWFFDDLMNDPGSVYREVLSFLDVADDERRDFARINTRKRARSRVLSLCTQKLPGPLASAAMKVKHGLGIQRLGILDTLRRANTQHGAKHALPSSLRKQMQFHFASDIHLLEDITGRDLSHWLHGSGSRGRDISIALQDRGSSA